MALQPCPFWLLIFIPGKRLKFSMQKDNVQTWIKSQDLSKLFRIYKPSANSGLFCKVSDLLLFTLQSIWKQRGKKKPAQPYYTLETVYTLPAGLRSPIRIMCGQCWSVFAKKGLVTPNMTDGLHKNKHSKNIVRKRRMFHQRRIVSNFFWVNNKQIIFSFIRCTTYKLHAIHHV